MSETILAIDLGTIDSCAALYRNGNVEVVPDVNGDKIIPSMVCYKIDTEQFLYGKFARNNSLQYAESTMFESKRLIGLKFHNKQVLRDIKDWNVKIIEDNKSKKPQYVIKVGNEEKKYFPEDVSSMILKYIINYCQVFNSNKKIEKAIITVPAHFNIFQREATIEAGKLAGLKEVTLLNEATAAAIAYADKFKSNEMKILVFDIGGGTFDVSILSVKGNKFKVLSSNGISHLGGEDFNQILLDYIKEEVKKQFKNVDFKNPRILKRFRKEVENKKKELSQINEVNIYIEALKDGEDFTMNITKKKYEELCMEKWKEMVPAVDRAIEIAKINKKDLNYIIFVGGPTRTPKIEEMVKEHFPNIEILKNVNVEEVVAYGAAISKKEKLIIEDTISKSFGIAIGNKEFSEIIPMGTNLPTTGDSKPYARTYTLEKGANTTQKIKVYEGTSKKAEENECLGEFNVNLEEDEKKITIKMKLDYNSILYVNAVVEGKKKTEEIKMTPKNY